MQNVTVICLGKLKEKYLRDAVDEYAKRLNAFCRLNIVELTPKRLSDNPSQTEIHNALESEGKEIISKIPNGSKIFALCIEGGQMSSEKLADELKASAVSGFSNLTFIIGSSFGLSDNVKNIADYKLSMSKMTFPHQLARVMLLEQIYRAYSINNSGKYHK